jgi:hypothetical protein
VIHLHSVVEHSLTAISTCCLTCHHKTHYLLDTDCIAVRRLPHYPLDAWCITVIRLPHYLLNTHRITIRQFHRRLFLACWVFVRRLHHHLSLTHSLYHHPLLAHCVSMCRIPMGRLPNLFRMLVLCSAYSMPRAFYVALEHIS